MAPTTVKNSRRAALVRRIDALAADPARAEAVALGLVDGVLERDGETLAAALDALRDASAQADGAPALTGWFDAAIAFAHAGVERLPSPTAVAPGTQAHRFLCALDGSPSLGSTDLRRRLETDETQVSRTGRRLLEGGLVTQRRAGRQVFWQLTPRGRQALGESQPVMRSLGPQSWQEALRRGYDGDRRDPGSERERIVECALSLHSSRGIGATTLEDIAARAGVPLDTVQALFPTQDDLVRSCGEHFMESLRLPPADRAADHFAGAATEPERLRRLVQTLFGAYERGAGGIVAGRRERHDFPVLDESARALEGTLDALVVEALRPDHPGDSSVAAVRALTDVEVWQLLRSQGADSDAAVDQASATVERWLAARAAG